MQLYLGSNPRRSIRCWENLILATPSLRNRCAQKKDIKTKQKHPYCSKISLSCLLFSTLFFLHFVSARFHPARPSCLTFHHWLTRMTGAWKQGGLSYWSPLRITYQACQKIEVRRGQIRKSQPVVQNISNERELKPVHATLQSKVNFIYSPPNLKEIRLQACFSALISFGPM